MDNTRELTGILLLACLVLVGEGSRKWVVAQDSAARTFAGKEQVWGYDRSNGTEETDIEQNFNLHRGRWWNYYERGSWYLAHDHFEAAKKDFEVVVEKRPTDKRDGRTYGMHFRDCFGHRELGIALYYLAIDKSSNADKLSLLTESIAELEKSWQQAPSPRAAFFLDLAKKSFWKLSDEDTTAPSIRVDNAVLTGRNWAVLRSDRRIVELTIRATDHQSGVSEIWIGEKRLEIERSTETVRRRINARIEDNNHWMVIRARDLAGNDSPPTTVRVDLDMSPPMIFATAHPEQLTPDGLVPVKCSARDNRGLRMIRVADQEIDCGGRLEYEGFAQIKVDGNKYSVELQATDLVGNTTEGSVDGLLEDTSAEEPLMTYSPPRIRSYWRSQRPTSTLPASLQPLAFAGLKTAPGSPLNVYAARNVSLDGWPVRTASSMSRAAGTASCSPVFAFNESGYSELPGGYPVASDQYLVEGKLNFAAGVEEIIIGDSNIPVEPNSQSIIFSELVSLNSKEITQIRVAARCASGSVMDHPKPFKVKSVESPVLRSDCVYSVVVLPLKLRAMPWNSDRNGPTVDLELQYDHIKDAVLDCNLHGPYEGRHKDRFNCSELRDLNLKDTRAILKGLVESDDEHFKAVKLGKECGVDLCIFGDIEDYGTHFQITLWVADITSEDENLLVKSPIGAYVEKDSIESVKERLKSRLEMAIPRVVGEVKGGPSGRPMEIELDKGRDDRLYHGRRLLVFKEASGSSGAIPIELVEAIVTTVNPNESIAEIVKRKGRPNNWQGVERECMFIMK